MKNLNKKIGALALAGMVLAGGVAVSGASAYANDNLDHNYLYQYEGLEFALSANSVNDLDVINIRDIEAFCKQDNFVIYDISKDSQKINRFIEKYLRKYAVSQKDLDSLNKVYHVNRLEDLKIQVKGLKAMGYKHARVSYCGMQYLFSLDVRQP